MPTALVTGASRGVGRGVAVALAEAGYDVYATSRTVASASLPAPITPIPADLTDDTQTANLFAQLPPLDLLVNAAWGGYERMIEDGRFTWSVPFWQQPLHRWQSMIDAGLRAAFAASRLAAPAMVEARRGLIVNISFWPAQKYVGNAIYGISKAATDKFTADAAHELRPHNVHAVSLYPGLVRTEAVLAAAQWLDLSNSESPEFIGRVIAALAADPDLPSLSGRPLVAAALALQYGIADVDGRRPVPLTIDNV